MRGGADVIYQATFFDGRWRRLRGLPAAGRDAERPRRLVVRGRRHEARAPRQGQRDPPDLLVRRAADARPGRRAGGAARRARRQRRARRDATASRTSWPTTGGSRRSSRPRSRPASRSTRSTATYPEPVEHCDVCRWVVDCKAQRRRGRRPLARRRASPRGSAGRSRTRGVRRRRELAVLAAAARRRASRASAAEALERVREQARIQVEGEDEGAPSWELLEPELDDERRPRAGPGLPRPARARRRTTCSSTSRATRSRSTTGSSTCSACSSRRSTIPSRPGAADVPRDLEPRRATGDVTRARRRRAFEQLVDLLIDRLDADPSMHVYHYAAYEKTALGAARAAPRDARGGGRPPAPRPRPRRPVPGRPPGHPGERRELLDQAARAAVRARARGGASGAPARASSRSRPGSRAATAENGEVGEAILRVDRGLQPRRRPRATGSCATGWRSAGSTSRRSSARPIPRPPTEPEAEAQPRASASTQQRVADARRRAHRRRARRTAASDRTSSTRAGCSPSSSTGTGARTRRSGGGSSSSRGMTDEELVDEREPLGRLELDRGPRRRTRQGTRLERYRFPPQDHGLQGRRARSSIRRRSRRRPKRAATVHEIDEIGLTVDAPARGERPAEHGRARRR